MKKIKVGVIGCGFIHNVYHMPAFRRVPEAEVVEAYGFPNELGHFVSCIGEGKQPSETFEDGLLINKIVDAAYRSVKSKRWENV